VFQRKNSRIFILTQYNESNYVNTSVLDTNRTEIQLGLTRAIGSNWQVQVEGILRKVDFVETTRKDTDLGLRAGVSRQFSNSLGINLDYRHANRDSNAPGNDYTENVIYLTFSFAR